MSEELIRQNVIPILGILYGGFFSYLIYRLIFAHRGQYLVRIKKGPIEEYRWRKPELDGEIIVMEKTTRKRPGWSFKLPSKISAFKSWGRTFFVVDIFYGAPKAIEYHFDTCEIDQPRWDKPTSHKFINAKILEKMGEEPKEKSSTIMLIVIGLIIVNILITLFVSGRIRIG